MTFKPTILTATQQQNLTWLGHLLLPKCSMASTGSRSKIVARLAVSSSRSVFPDYLCRYSVLECLMQPDVASKR